MAREFKKRDKHVHKMTRDGLVDQNLVTGEETRISQRGQDFNLQQRLRDFSVDGNPKQGDSPRAANSRAGHPRQQQPHASEASPDVQQTSDFRQNDAPIRPDHAVPDTHHHPSGDGFPDTTTHTSVSESPARHAPGISTSGESRRSGSSSGRSQSAHRNLTEDCGRISGDTIHTEQPDIGHAPDSSVPHDAVSPAAPSTGTESATPAPYTTERSGSLRYGEDRPTTSHGSKPDQHGTKYSQRFSADTEKPPVLEAARPDTPTALNPTKPRQHGTKYSQRFNEATHDHPASDTALPDRSASDTAKPSASEVVRPDTARPAKSGRLQFSKEEQPVGGASADKPPSRKLTKARNKAEKSAAKLDVAKKKLPTKRKIKLDKTVDPETGTPKRHLHFETEVKSQRAHVKGPMPLRPVKFGANAAIGYAHRKLSQVEHENVGTEAAHKGQLIVEGTARKAYRLHKTAPYRRVAKLERLTAKRNVNHLYQQALNDNPKLRSNLLSRMMQKQKIKRQYAKAAKDAKRTASAVKKTGGLIKDAATAVVSVVRSHPAVFGTIALLLVLVLLIMGMFGSCSNMAVGGLSSILASSYLAEDSDVDNAELAYTEWETDLQMKIASAESDHPGFDEYRYNVDDIGHNPYELMAYLTAKYQDFTFAAVEADLRAIFAEQYQLSFDEEVEVRYRTETHTDPDTGEDYEVEVPYNWYILNVNLTARSFSDVIAPRLGSDQREIFDLLMQTKGNRQYALNPFSFNWLPYISSYYGWRVHPVTDAKDYHKGIDIAVPAGTEIIATHDGKVTFAGNSGDYGLVVVIEDDKAGSPGGSLVTKYAHCSELLVSAGQEVKKGDPIAKVGSTGNSTGPHLHFEVIKNGQYLNPLFFSETGDDGSGYIPPGSPGGVVFPDYPGAPLGDGSFAAMMEEAEKHLGKKYVFGASGPANFDCSGFVSWVLDKSGVKRMGRTNAQGLYNMCTPVSAANAQPGDLIFFTGTYSTSNACSHVGIYIGNGMMIHCGNPIQYTSINTSYWQSHFYAFARIN